MTMSSKLTSGESARFHLSDYRLVARHNFWATRYTGSGALDRLNRLHHVLMSARDQSCALPRALDTRNRIIRPLTDHGQVINVSCFKSPVATFRRQKIQLISSAARTQSSRRHSDRRCLCTSLPADTGTEAASSSRALGPGPRTSTQ